MKLLTGNVLIKITAAQKKELLEPGIITDAGQVVSLFREIEQEADMAGSYNQAVQTGEILAVADDVRHFQAGDIAILDYLVDTSPEMVVFEDQFVKLLCVDTRTIYHEDDNIVYGNLKNRADMYVWSKGDVDQASLVYGAFRGDQLIPNPPYIICEHKDFLITSKSTTGLEYQYFEKGAVIRRILVPNVFSDPNVKPGTLVVVEQFCLYERTYKGKFFDVIMDQDIELAFEKESDSE